MERCLILVKPDGVERNLIGEVISRFERKGLAIKALKMMRVTREQAEDHYSVHRLKPFFDDLVSYLTSGPIVAMIVEGNNAIASSRMLAGATDGSKAAPGTIRGDFSLDIERNIVHASDSLESYEHEYKIFFNENEIMD
uniref:Nucleoside diphosphate kinase n=2 Tax=Picrophilus torridus (strain ATCC 700027 / DSM 9790 / JCM 10055 / NBRC 100828 / KAW 2/3) TaxID=1122961 RepID=NDK_PICTO|nr:RecName: Full=Nucleoside diphosphate kinase; Short=NDK; Short=NDP kinase; AltName: Full=Nucleoside-2-P kinase [Picrophilus oshimae DSM 9789]